jgi:predicted nucleic acid-binding protein
MILYLGTSSLVKLYVDKPHSATIRAWVRDAEIIATCRLTYTEFVSSLDNRYARGEVSKGDYDSLVKAFADDWPHFAVIDFDEIEAVNLVMKYGLRRFDALHLSAAKLLRGAGNGLSVIFSSADPNLVRAASAEGFRVVELRE